MKFIMASNLMNINGTRVKSRLDPFFDMKKQCLFLAAIFSLFVAIEGNAAVEWEVFGPTTIAGGKNAPVAKTFTFSALGGQATIKLSNTNVSSAKATFNGEVVFGSSDFNRNINFLEKGIVLVKGQNTLEVSLASRPGGELTIRIIQEVAEITPEIVLVRTANYLRAGDIERALEGFVRNERAEYIPGLDYVQRKYVANCLENAEFLVKNGAIRWYRYTWTDETGENFVDFSIIKDEQGRWVISSW